VVTDVETHICDVIVPNSRVPLGCTRVYLDLTAACLIISLCIKGQDI